MRVYLLFYILFYLVLCDMHISTSYKNIFPRILIAESSLNLQFILRIYNALK